MTTLLHIDSSPRGERSHSRQLTAHFVDAWRQAHPGGSVVRRDLGLHPVPLISDAWIAAAFTPPDHHGPAQRAAIACSNELVDELLAADHVVIGAPMHNFAITAALKAWIDQVVRVGRTIEYPSFQGLVHGKRVTIIATRGGAGLGPGEAMAARDAQVPYLKLILNFMGLTQISVVYAGGLAVDATPEASLRRAADEAAALARA